MTLLSMEGEFSTKILFYSFLNDSDCFRLCERMRKHAFTGQNTQQATRKKYLGKDFV